MSAQVLIDNPWDGYAEAWCYVEATIHEDKARDLVTEFCVDEDGEPARPIGPATEVYLRLTNPAADYEDQRWTKCKPTAKTAVRFYEFDATDTRSVASERTQRS